MRKGETDVLGVPLELVLIFLAVLVVGGLLTNSILSGNSIKDWFCKGTGYSWCNPPSGNEIAQDNAIALMSSKALACAINAVIGNNHDLCKTVKSLDNKQMVVCTQTGGGTECTVSEYQLPQNIETDEKTLLAYVFLVGDPIYLNYFQSFPADQDTWTFKPGWRSVLVWAAIMNLPVGKVFGAVKGVAKGVFSTATGTLLKKLGTEAETNVIVNAAARGIIVIPDNVVSKALKDAAKKGFAETIKKQAEKFGKNIMTKYLLPFAEKGLVPMVKKVGDKVVITLKTGAVITIAGVEGGIAIGDALSESVIKKYEPHPNSLALASPYTDPVIEEIDTNGIPVFVYQQVGFSKNIVPLHFVSPCSIKTMTVSQKIFQCASYEKTETGVVRCEGPVVTGQMGEKVCDNFDKAFQLMLGDNYAKNLLTDRVSQKNVEITEERSTSQRSIGQVAADYKAYGDIYEIRLPLFSPDIRLRIERIQLAGKQETLDSQSTGLNNFFQRKVDVKIAGTTFQVNCPVIIYKKNTVSGYNVVDEVVGKNPPYELAVVNCDLDMATLSVAKQNTAVDGISLIANNEGTIIAQAYKIKGLEGTYVLLIDDDGDGFSDTVKVLDTKKDIRVEVPASAFLGKEPEYVYNEDCWTHGIIVSDIQPAKTKGLNYCISTEKKTRQTLEVLGTAGSVAIGIFATVYSGGTVWIPVLLWGTAAATGVSAQYSDAYEGTWPTRGIG